MIQLGVKIDWGAPENDPVVTVIFPSESVTSTGAEGSVGVAGARWYPSDKPSLAAKACPVHFRLPSGQLLYAKIRNRRTAGAHI